MSTDPNNFLQRVKSTLAPTDTEPQEIVYAPAPQDNPFETTWTESVEFDLNDPIHKALLRVFKILTSKGHDYTADTDQFSSFRTVAEHSGIPLREVADLYEVTKLSRIKALRNRADPMHEAVGDTYLDKAAYAVLALAMYLEGE